MPHRLILLDEHEAVVAEVELPNVPELPSTIRFDGRTYARVAPDPNARTYLYGVEPET